MERVALINDTVGCLMPCSFTNHDALIGVMLGTGTNACYMDRIENVEWWAGDNDESKLVSNTHVEVCWAASSAISLSLVKIIL